MRNETQIQVIGIYRIAWRDRCCCCCCCSAAEVAGRRLSLVVCCFVAFYFFSVVPKMLAARTDRHISSVGCRQQRWRTPLLALVTG